jgi:hypothetical protein
MACASLFSLKDESKVGAGVSPALDQSLNIFANNSLDLIGLMAHYHVNGFWSQFQGRAYNVRDQRQARNLVKHFCAPRPHASPQPGGQDHNICHNGPLSELRNADFGLRIRIRNIFAFPLCLKTFSASFLC